MELHGFILRRTGTRGTYLLPATKPWRIRQRFNGGHPRFYKRGFLLREKLKRRVGLQGKPQNPPLLISIADKNKMVSGVLTTVVSCQ